MIANICSHGSSGAGNGHRGAAQHRAVGCAISVQQGHGSVLVAEIRAEHTHGGVEFVLEGRGYARCPRCRSEAVAKRRRRVKELLVAEAGGACILCGYARTSRALEFHHLDPSVKRFGLSSGCITMSLDAARTEAAKCVLLCSNCHAEVEDGLAAVPIELLQPTECSANPALQRDGE